MTLITKKGFCPQCMMTEKVLKSKGKKFTVKHIQNVTQRNHILDLGYKSYPICLPNDKWDKDVFCGFRPERL